jgi:hypothetical protein
MYMSSNREGVVSLFEGSSLLFQRSVLVVSLTLVLSQCFFSSNSTQESAALHQERVTFDH